MALRICRSLELAPAGRLLMIHPPYVHFMREAADGVAFSPDANPYLPLGPLYAAEVLRKADQATTVLYDCQLHPLLKLPDVSDFDCVGINVMGAQNLAAAHRVFELVRSRDPQKAVYLGGQGAEFLTDAEVERVFPGAILTPRAALESFPGYWQTNLTAQFDALSEEDLRSYLSNEITLLFSQGCMFGCGFCAAQSPMRERFYDMNAYLEMLLVRAVRLGIHELSLYCTSLDFFQQCLPGQSRESLVHQLETIVALREKHGVDLRLRALTRADSYNAAMRSGEVLALLKAAGFYKFGFGADGAASLEVLQAMRRGTATLKSDLLEAFDHAERHDLVPEILYVFGVPEDDEESLRKTKDFCTTLLRQFPHAQYRGFPAKNEVPGNRRWASDEWRNSAAYAALFAEPRLFLNLGFETMANFVSHPDPDVRRLVNKCAVEMSLTAHEFGRVQSYLTVPIMRTDGHELMTEDVYAEFEEIMRRYLPEGTDCMGLRGLPLAREHMNRFVPKDR